MERTQHGDDVLLGSVKQMFGISNENTESRVGKIFFLSWVFKFSTLKHVFRNQKSFLGFFKSFCNLADLFCKNILPTLFWGKTMQTQVCYQETPLLSDATPHKCTSVSVLPVDARFLTYKPDLQGFYVSKSHCQLNVINLTYTKVPPRLIRRLFKAEASVLHILILLFIFICSVMSFFFSCFDDV